MKPHLIARVAQILAALVLAGTAGAAEQIVTPDPVQVSVAANQPLSLAVSYTTADPCADGLAGLGLRPRWDSSWLDFTGLTDLLPTALIAQGPVEEDIPDANDNCSADPDPGQQDNEPDGQGDIRDLDNDNDGVPDAEDGAPAMGPTLVASSHCPRAASIRPKTAEMGRQRLRRAGRRRVPLPAGSRSPPGGRQAAITARPLVEQ